MWRYVYTINSAGGPGFGELVENGDQWYGNAGGNSFPNRKIKWETTLTRNAAFDIGFFDNRLSITPEVYWNTTKNLLYMSDIPTTTGYTQQMQNIDAYPIPFLSTYFVEQHTSTIHKEFYLLLNQVSLLILHI